MTTVTNYERWSEDDGVRSGLGDWHEPPERLLARMRDRIGTVLFGKEEVITNVLVAFLQAVMCFLRMCRVLAKRCWREHSLP